MPACLCRAGHLFGAFAQQDRGYAGLAGDEIQPAAGDKIQGLGRTGNFQEQRPHGSAGQNVAGGDKRLGGIGRSYQKKVLRPSAQLRHALGVKRAIFQRLIIRPHPKQGLLACRQNRQAGGKATRRPVRGIDFMQGAGDESAAQRLIRRRHAQRQKRPRLGQAVARQKMPQILYFF